MDRGAPLEFRGNATDLARFGRDVLKQTVALEQVSPFEHCVRWDLGGTRGFGATAELRSGVKLASTRLRWEQPWTFPFVDPATPLKFILSQGAGPRMTPTAGDAHVLGGGLLHVRHATRSMPTTCHFEGSGAEFRLLALEVAPDHLRQLAGAAALPAVLETVLAGTNAAQTHEQPLVPALTRLTEELLYADARGPSRQLYLEAKGLEVLAVILDELSLASQSLAPLGQADTDRLERAKRLLQERLACPPSLAELARAVGVNEFKLKAGFRAVFGTSVFGCLRTQRMERARRLLTDRDRSVTEVAAQVGYANPSKFAAAFRKHFGFPPSAVR